MSVYDELLCMNGDLLTYSGGEVFMEFLFLFMDKLRRFPKPKMKVSAKPQKNNNKQNQN